MRRKFQFSISTLIYLQLVLAVAIGFAQQAWFQAMRHPGLMIHTRPALQSQVIGLQKIGAGVAISGYEYDAASPSVIYGDDILPRWQFRVGLRPYVAPSRALLPRYVAP